MDADRVTVVHMSQPLGLGSIAAAFREFPPDLFVDLGSRGWNELAARLLLPSVRVLKFEGQAAPVVHRVEQD